MADRSGRARRPWPLGLLGMLALVAAVEATLGRHDQPTLSTNAAMSWRFAGRAAESRAVACDLLCFGDSQVQFSLIPQILAERSGLRSYNLGLHAGPPTASYLLLKKALAAGARPRAVVVDFQPHVLGMDPADQARLFAEMLGPLEALELAGLADDPALFAEVALGRLLPSVRDRHEVRAAILGVLRGEDPAGFARHWFTPLWRNWRVNHGATVYPSDPAHAATLPGDHWLAPARWSRDPAVAVAIRRFLDLAAERRIEVFWLLPPIHPSVEVRRAERGLEAPFTEFVARVQGRYPNVHVLDARDSGYGREAFSDVAHLGREGAAVLSADVGEAVARHLAGEAPPGRWTDLPGFRPVPIRARFEDVNESRVALKIGP